MDLQLLSACREEFLKIAAAMPPPLPPAANPMAQALFEGAKKSPVNPFKSLTGAASSAGKNALLSKLVKRAGVVARAARAAGVGGRALQHLDRHSHAYDLAGLGVLAAPAALGVKKNIQQARSGQKMEGLGHNLAEIGGLGLIAAPVAAQMMLGKH